MSGQTLSKKTHELELSEVDFERLHQFSKTFPKTVQKKISLLKQKA
jgi:hypothetical protein